MKKYKKAQHLVEFAVIAPILMLILLVIAEYGYVLIVRTMLGNATQMSLVKVSKNYADMPGTSEEKLTRIQNALGDDIDNYLYTNNIPYSGTINVTIQKISGTEQAIVTATYTYYPAFLLPQVLGGHVIPDQIVLASSQIINEKLLEPNSYAELITTNNIGTFTNSTPLSDTVNTRKTDLQ